MILRSRTNRTLTFAGRLNLTPMIDIVFQLLVFFMVASHLTAVEREPVRLPKPTESQAKEKQLNRRLIINLFADPAGGGRIHRIKVNAELVPDLPALVDTLLRVGPKLQAAGGTVLLRADRDLPFEQIEKVLQAIANAGVTSVHIAAEQTAGTGTKS